MKARLPDHRYRAQRFGRHLRMETPPIQILPVHRLIERILAHGRLEAFPGKHPDGLLLQPHPEDEVVKHGIDGCSRAFREACPGEQGLHSHLAPEGGEETVDQNATGSEEIGGQGWQFDGFRGTLHWRRSLGVGVDVEYPTLYSLRVHFYIYIMLLRKNLNPETSVYKFWKAMMTLGS